MKKYLLFTIVTIALVSCAPKVTSEMLTNGFQAQLTNKIMIFGPKDSVPETVKAIGQVTVDGKKTSLRKQYTRAVDLAVKETARNGGNVLVVDNRELKDNRLKGTIAYTDEKIIDSLTLSLNRVNQLQHMPIFKKPKDVKVMDDKEQHKIMQQQEALKAEEQERLMPVYLRRDSIYNANPEAYFDLTEDSYNNTTNETDFYDDSEKKSHDGVIKVSFGPDWTTSKIYYNNGRDYMSDITGHAFSLSLSSTGGRLFGWGFDLYGSMTELDLLSYRSSEKYNLTLIYIGPSAVMSGNLNDKLRLDFVLSSGVACYTDNDHVGIGFGLKTTMGMEYMVSKKVGIGLDMLAITTIFGNPSGVNLPNNEVYGYRQLGLMLTGRFHF